MFYKAKVSLKPAAGLYVSTDHLYILIHRKNKRFATVWHLGGNKDRDLYFSPVFWRK